MSEASKKGIRPWWLHLRLSQKLLLSYLLLILLPLGSFTIAAYSRVEAVLREQLLHSAKYAFDRTWDYTSYLVDRIVHTSDTVTLDNTVSGTLDKELATYSLAEQYRDMNTLRSYLNSFVDKTDGLRLRLYVPDVFVYAKDEDILIGTSVARKQGWFSRLRDSSVSFLLCPSAYMDGDEGGNTLSLVRRLRRSDDYQVTLAYLRIDFNAARVQQILNHANPTQGSLTYLINSEDVIVAASDWQLAKTATLAYDALPATDAEAAWTLVEEGGTVTYRMARRVPRTDWLIATVIPATEINTEIDALRGAMAVLLLLISVASYSAAVYVSRSITRPLTTLTAKMKRVQGGELHNVMIEAPGKDEIGELTQDYNFMIQRIISLMEEQKRIGMEMKSADLRALQAQINPHFLYNTLDMINWMSYSNQGAEIRALVRSLSAFYKLSLNEGREIVPLRDELSHVSFYVQIQKMRLAHSLHFIVDVEEACLDYGIIKITLQPLVENAILHGLADVDDDSAMIEIRAGVQGENLRVSVRDNGCGMSPERLLEVFDAAYQGGDRHSFGMRNINDRYRLLYGPAYGITVKSEAGKGTTVHLLTPLVRCQ